MTVFSLYNDVDVLILLTFFLKHKVGASAFNVSHNFFHGINAIKNEQLSKSSIKIVL